MQIFEFGEYWDTKTFILFLLIGIITAALFHFGTIKQYKHTVLNYRKKTNTNVYYITAYLIFVIFYALKDISFGADSTIYINNYFLPIKDRISHISSGKIITLGQTEPLFLALLYIIRLFSDNYTIFFLVTGIIVAYGYVKFIHCFTTLDYEFAFLIPVFTVSYTYDMNIMRSALATSFMLQSLCFLLNKNTKKAIFFTCIASLFHYTMIVNFGFILFFTIWNKQKILSLKKSVILLIIFSVLMVSVTILLRPYLETKRYSAYLSRTPMLLGHWPDIATTLLCFLIILYKKNTEDKIRVPIAVGLFNIIILISIFIIKTGRLTYYYSVPRLVVWAYYIPQFIRKEIGNTLLRKIIVLIVVIIYALFVLSRRSGAPGFEYAFRNINEII